jgi:hypothetical protein
LSASAGCFDFSKRNKSPVIDKHYINGRLFLYNKNQRNFPQDWEKLLTRFAASCNKISGIPVSCVFLCSFLWAYSSSGGKYAPPEELPQKSFRSFSLSANCLFMGFPAEGLALKILQPGIYSFSRHIRFFSYGCVLSGIFGVFPMYLRAFHLSAIGYAEEFFFSLKDFEVSILQPECR